FTLAQVAGLIILGPLIFLLVPSFALGTIHHYVEIAPAEVLFALLAVLYLICAGLILLIPRRRIRPMGRPRRTASRVRRDTRQVRNIWSGMVECWHLIRHDRRLFISVFQLAFAGSFIAVIAMIAPRFVTAFFNRPAALAALVFVPAGAGLIIGSALVPRVSRHIGYNLTIFFGVTTLALSAALLPLVRAIASSPALDVPEWYYAWPYVALILLLTFIIGVALDLINVPAQTRLQERAPDWIKGRVLAVQALLLNAVTIPFVLIIGRIADIAGLMFAIEVLGVTIAVLGLGSLYVSTRGQPWRDRSAARAGAHTPAERPAHEPPSRQRGHRR
ncbi:MAG: MFS transporter, partial [Ktedonobacterales bacterium]|nr:MFS transporter [Ktedonobacterales bacterium]